jgi:hypothetical protein
VVGSAAGKVFHGDAVGLNPIDAIREGVTVETKDRAAK